ncbi:MAG TPA: carboxypeptidase-like regulatory domain-containing protein, partial [Candidatus Eisenbacteria bacterium]
AAAPAPGERAQAKATGPATTAPPEPMSAPNFARTGRAQEVRRDERGEEVPVSPPSGPAALYARPPAPAQTSEVPAGPVTVKKQERAMPMGTPGMPAAEKTGGAPAAPEPSPAAGAALDQAVAIIELCGDVRDPSGRPVAGASVVIADNGVAARTDAKGRFCVSGPAGDRTLAVLAVGYVPARQGVRFVAGAPRASIALEPVAVLSGPRATGAQGFAAPPPAGGDVFGALPDSLRSVARGAELLSASAAQLKSAAAYDRAADAWSALAPSLAAGPLESGARFEAASARVHAWEIAPTPERRAAAAASLDAYLARAEPGARRDRALAWRGRL